MGAAETGDVGGGQPPGFLVPGGEHPPPVPVEVPPSARTALCTANATFDTLSAYWDRSKTGAPSRPRLRCSNEKGRHKERLPTGRLQPVEPVPSPVGEPAGVVEEHLNPDHRTRPGRAPSRRAPRQSAGPPAPSHPAHTRTARGSNRGPGSPGAGPSIVTAASGPQHEQPDEAGERSVGGMGVSGVVWVVIMVAEKVTVGGAGRRRRPVPLVGEASNVNGRSPSQPTATGRPRSSPFTVRRTLTGQRSLTGAACGLAHVA